MLAQAANKSAVTMEDLRESLQYVGPVANDLGVSLADTLALVGALGNVGIKGSEAGTALRRLNLLATAGSDKLQKLFGYK